MARRRAIITRFDDGGLAEPTPDELALGETMDTLAAPAAPVVAIDTGIPAGVAMPADAGGQGGGELPVQATAQAEDVDETPANVVRRYKDLGDYKPEPYGTAPPVAPTIPQEDKDLAASYREKIRAGRLIVNKFTDRKEVTDGNKFLDKQEKEYKDELKARETRRISEHKLAVSDFNKLRGDHMSQQRALQAQHETERRRLHEAELKLLGDRQMSRTERDDFDEKFADKVATIKTKITEDPKSVPPKYVNSALPHVEADVLNNIALRIATNNKNINANNALDTVLALTTSARAPEDKGRNGKTGAAATNYTIEGKDVLDNIIVKAPNGELLHIPSATMKAIEKTRRLAYIKAQEAKAKADEEAAKPSALGKLWDATKGVGSAVANTFAPEGSWVDKTVDRPKAPPQAIQTGSSLADDARRIARRILPGGSSLPGAIDPR